MESSRFLHLILLSVSNYVFFQISDSIVRLSSRNSDQSVDADCELKLV